MRLPHAVSRLLSRARGRHARQPQVRPVVPVRDLDRAQQVVESLGLQVQRWDAGYAWVLHDGSEVLHLKVVTDLDPASNHAEVYVFVDDVEQWHDRFVGAGLDPGPVASRPWGMREFGVTDHDGNHLRFGRNDAD